MADNHLDKLLNDALAIKEAAEQCTCEFDCYCSRNIVWAERQIERAKARRQGRSSWRGDV